MNDNNNENVEEESVSLFDMYGVDQTIKHKEPRIVPVIKDEEEESTEEVQEETTTEDNNSSEEQTNSNDQGEYFSNEDVNNKEQEAPKEVNSLSDIDNQNNETTEEVSEEPPAGVDIDEDVDQELLEAFIGDAYRDYCTNGFNVGAFFFGATYFIYRKMFLYGIALMCLSSALSMVPTLSVLGLAIPFLTGIFGNKIYRDFAIKKVKNIQANNQGISRNELIEMCRYKGGTSLGCALIPLIVVVVLFIIAGMIIVSAGAIVK